jgi:exodeoxyribonuclease VII small subunit
MPPSKPKPKSSLTSVSDLSYEQALAELEAIASTLESNQLQLEETMAQYERGQQLIRHCVELLDKAELRLKQLSGDTLVDISPAEEE